MFGFGSTSGIYVIGNLGKDPELNVTQEGTPVTKFSVAETRFKGKRPDGSRNEETIWWSVICWRELAEQTEKWLFKGAKVFVEGKLEIRKYTDRNGTERTAVEIIAGNIQLLSKPGGAAGNSAPVDDSGREDPFMPDYPDDLS